MAILSGSLVRVSRAALAAALVVCAAAPRAEQRTATAEDDIKAAFLYNFTKFIDWPGPAQSEPFRICTVAEPAFASALDRTIAGESVNGRPIQRVTPPAPDAARTCAILFLGRMENDRAERWIAAVRSLPVLVVGESRGAWDRGAQINLVVEENRVKFDVNTDTAAQAGLTISSKLLRVARHVSPKRGRGE